MRPENVVPVEVRLRTGGDLGFHARQVGHRVQNPWMNERRTGAPVEERACLAGFGRPARGVRGVPGDLGGVRCVVRGVRCALGGVPGVRGIPGIVARRHRAVARGVAGDAGVDRIGTVRREFTCSPVGFRRCAGIPTPHARRRMPGCPTRHDTQKQCSGGPDTHESHCHDRSSQCRIGATRAPMLASSGRPGRRAT